MTRQVDGFARSPSCWAFFTSRVARVAQNYVTTSMSPARRLLPRTLSSHRERARRECSRVRAGALAVWPPPEPERAAVRPHFRVCGYKQGTSTFPVHKHNEATRRAVSCFTNARATQRRVDPTAARLLPHPVSPTLLMDSLCTSGAAHTLRSQTLPVPPRPSEAQPPGARTGPDPRAPRRPVYAPRQYGPCCPRVHHHHRGPRTRLRF